MPVSPSCTLWIAGYRAKPKKWTFLFRDPIIPRNNFPSVLMSVRNERKCLYLCTCWHFGCYPANPLSRSLGGEVQYFIWQAHTHTQSQIGSHGTSLCLSLSADLKWFCVMFDILIFRADILSFCGQWSQWFLYIFFVISLFMQPHRKYSTLCDCRSSNKFKFITVKFELMYVTF